jgi:hypothetical protein
MENYNPYQSSLEQLSGSDSAPHGSVTPRMLEILSKTKPWVQFMAIMLFIGAAFMLIYTLVLLGMGAFATRSPFGPGFPVALMVGGAFIYGIMGALYLVLGIRLWKYGSHIRELLFEPRVERVELALDQQQKFWKLTGICTITMLVLVILSVVVVLIFGVFMAKSITSSRFPTPSPPPPISTSP